MWGKKNSRANLWPDEQKPHKRSRRRVRLPYKPKPCNYTDSCGINVAGRWRERTCEYPGRSVRYAPKGVTTAGSSAERTEVSRGHSSGSSFMKDYGIADMKNNIEKLNGWLYRRIRMCTWKEWKLPKTRKRKLLGLGLPEWVACEGAYSRKSYWRMANTGVVKRALRKERLINWGFYDLTSAYQSLHVNY